MSIAYVLIPLSLVLMAVAAWALFWAVDSGQFDDLDAPARAILDEEEQGAPARTNGNRADTGSLPPPDGGS